MDEEPSRPERIRKYSEGSLGAWDVFLGRVRAAQSLPNASGEFLDLMAEAFEDAVKEGAAQSVKKIRALETDIAKHRSISWEAQRREKHFKQVISDQKKEMARIRRDKDGTIEALREENAELRDTLGKVRGR